MTRSISPATIRFSDDGDPAIGAAVYGVATRKMEKYPAWSRRVEELFGADI